MNVPGHNNSAEISGFNQQDHMLMGILRAISDAIIVGAGTLRVASNHQWTPSHIYPPLADAYSQLRSNLGKSELPLNVFVTELGNINLHLPVFQFRRDSSSDCHHKTWSRTYNYSKYTAISADRYDC